MFQPAAKTPAQRTFAHVAFQRSAVFGSLLVALITLAALLIRVLTLRHGLPYVQHPDEPNPIEYVVQMLKTGDLDPHAFQKPHLYVYLLYIVLSVQYYLGLANGQYIDLNQMVVTTHLYTTLPDFFLWGRVLTAVVGSVTVLAAYGLGQRVLGARAGIVAALFIAVSPFHMRHSQYVTTDVTSGLFVLLAFWGAVLVAQRGNWRDYLLAGVCAGLAASTKYNAGVAALPIIVAHGLRWRRAAFAKLPMLVGAGALALVGFVAGTPYALLSFSEFRSGIAGQWHDYQTGEHGDFTGVWNWHGYYSFFKGDEFGWLALVATLVGLALLLWRRRDVGLLWLAFVVPYLLVHMSRGSHFTRNLIPVVVLCALPIGALAHVSKLFNHEATKTRRIGKNLRVFVASWFVIAVIIALLVPSALATASYSQRMARGDTRTNALDWIAANIPPGTRIAAELRPLPGAVESRWAEAEALPAHDLAWYRQQGYSYVLASSDAWKQWALPDAYTQWAQAHAPIATFGGADPREMLGPHILIYPTGLRAADVPKPLTSTVMLDNTQLRGVAIGKPDTKQPQLGVQSARTYKPGDPLALRTFWQVNAPFTQNYLIFVHVLDANNAIVAQRDAPPWLGLFPTTTWRAGSLVVDVNDLALPASIAPGEYRVVVGMFNPASGAHPAVRVDGNAWPSGEIEVARVTVKK